MTINKRKGSYHEPLYGISSVSCGFAPTSRSKCRNICRVRAKYMQSTCKKCSRLWAPFPQGGVIIEEHTLGNPSGNFLGDFSTKFPYYVLYVPSIRIYTNQSEPIGTNFRFESKSILAHTHQFSIRIKIHLIPFSFSFSFTCTIFDSNENQRHWSYNANNAVMCRYVW